MRGEYENKKIQDSHEKHSSMLLPVLIFSYELERVYWNIYIKKLLIIKMQLLLNVVELNSGKSYSGTLLCCRDHCFISEVFTLHTLPV